MILSHRYKFIFLKTSKTAGTSVEIALSKFLGPKDVITPISPEDEETRRDLGYRGPQNYRAKIWEYPYADLVKLVSKGEWKEKFYNHISAFQVRGLVGEQVWNTYFKFCIERNPWDRVISHYYWSYQEEPRPTISEYLETDLPIALKNWGMRVYTINDEIVVDRVLRFENLSAELEAVRRQLNIPEPLELPRAKARFRKDKRPAAEILNAEEKARIAQIFEKEITQYGYEI